MAHLIDKDAVVAEIKRRMDENRGKQTLPQYFGMIEEDLNILSFIDTLEVKEVDLEKEIELVKGDYEQVDVAWNNDFDFIARHFFELGLKAQKGESV